jgi:protein-S-isoprenylcysteine O-methyltransferase Ste14
VHVHLAHAEDAEAKRTFGADYDRYAATTPAWIPHRRWDRPLAGQP